MDQTNPLAQLTHERRLTALGPGGLNRKRAGFEVRDVHISHYGRICPIETPEGTNIGLISSLSIYAGVDEYGFLITPYRKVKKRKLTDDVKWLRADEEIEGLPGPGRHAADGRARSRRTASSPAFGGDFGYRQRRSGSVHGHLAEADGRRLGRSDSVPGARRRQPRLMGSNMQRQAVPLLVTEPPLVSTGLEKEVARNSGMVIRAEKRRHDHLCRCQAHQGGRARIRRCANSSA